METNSAVKEPSKLKVNSNLRTLGLPSLSDPNLREIVKDLSLGRNFHQLNVLRTKYRKKGLSDGKIDKLIKTGEEILTFLPSTEAEVKKRDNFLLVKEGQLTEARSELEREKYLVRGILNNSNQKNTTRLERENDALINQKLKLSNANESLRFQVVNLKTEIAKLKVTVNMLKVERDESKKEYRKMQRKYYNLQRVQTARKESKFRRVQRICRHALKKKDFCHNRIGNFQEAKSK